MLGASWCVSVQVVVKGDAHLGRLAGINSSVRVRPMIADLTPSNAEELLGGAGVIVDGTDNFEARFLLNDFAVSRGVPWIYGAAVGSCQHGCTASCQSSWRS